ncbi:putative outer membrane protein [Vibrio astriarenae]|nr:putative outer membrane protein [Vibrio sp. C7]
MKTSAVASALLLALASTSTVAATVYSNDGTELSIGGRVEFRGDFSDSVDGTMKDSSRARLNFKGSSEITSGLTAFGFYETEVTGKKYLTITTQLTRLLTVTCMQVLTLK